MNTPLWKEEFSVQSGDDRYVQRRQFTKFLILTSFAMFAGQVWVVVKSFFRRTPRYLPVAIAKIGEIPVGEVKLFRYPGPEDHCILIHPDENTYVAYNQKCTHLSCAVYYAAKHKRLECPCHEGYFAIDDGRVLQGPPPRPLPKVILERSGDNLIAMGMVQS